MRRGLLFFGLFLISLVIVYMEPIWSYQISPNDGQELPLQSPPPTSLNLESIPTQGIAQWIGQPMKAFTTLYGEAQSVTDSGFGFFRHQFRMDADAFLEVTTIDQRITSIKLLGETPMDIGPFEYQMSLEELTTFTVISPIVSVEYGGETYSLELMEDDINYRPLVAFDNGSYAILFFDHQDKRSGLYSLMYLDTETLLKLAPYVLTEGQPQFFVAEKAADWITIDEQKSETSRYLMQQLRRSYDFPAYSTSLALQRETQALLTDFLVNQEDYLSTERLRSFQRIQRQELNQNWVLTNQEVRTLVEELDEEKTFAHFEMPVYDPIFTLLSWYSNPYLVSRLFYDESEAIGVAFSKENMLVLFQEINQPTESSEQP